MLKYMQFKKTEIISGKQNKTFNGGFCQLMWGN